MNGPEPRWQSAKLNSLDPTALDECDRVLKVVVRVLRPISSKDAARRHRFTVDGFNYPHLIRAYLNQRGLANDLLEGPLDQVKTRFQHVCLNADFAFGRNHAPRRHLRAEVTPLFDCNLTRPDVHKNSTRDHQQDNERQKPDEEVRKK